MCQLLLDHGADPNICDSKGQSALDLACASYSYANISTLLSCGASVLSSSSLSIAGAHGRPDVVSLLLQQKVTTNALSVMCRFLC